MLNEVIYKDGLNWFWPIGIREPEWLFLFIQRKFGVNENFEINSALSFFAQLRASLSLNFYEKMRVLDSYKTLTELQISAMSDVFSEESEKFLKLEVEHPSDFSKLVIRNEFEWAILINPETGVHSFFDNYIFKERIKISDADWRFLYHKTNQLLEQRELYPEQVFFNDYLFKKGLLSGKQLLDSANTVTYALVKSGMVSKIGDLKKNKIFSQAIEESKPSSRAFLKGLPYLYFYEAYGIKGLTKKQFKNLLSLYKASKGPSDFAASIAYIYLCQGNMQKACNALRWSIRKYNSDRKFSLQGVIKKLNLDSPSNQSIALGNTISNLMRFSISNNLIDRNVSKERGEVIFAKLSKKLTKLKLKELQLNIIPLLYFLLRYKSAKGNQFMKSSHFEILVKSDDHNVACCFLSFSNSNYISFDDMNMLRKALLNYTSKVSILWVILALIDIKCSQATSQFEFITYFEGLKSIYQEVIVEKEMSLEKELDFELIPFLEA